MKVGIVQVALATVGFLSASGLCLAEQTSEIMVEAPHVEKTKQPGEMGQQLTAISIVNRVSFADLNLGTHSGAVELQKRIKESATKICAQLVKLYPESSEGGTPCVQGAIKSAMAQADKAIAAAEKAAKK